MAVRSEDAAAIEEVLDRVDGLFAEAPPVAASMGEVWSIALGILGLIPTTSWVLGALAGTALVRPSFPTLMALGASGLASAAAVPDPWWRSAILALAGVASLSVAFRARALPRTRTDVLLATLVPLGLVLLSGLGGATAFLSSLPAMHVSLWAGESPSAFVGIVAIGAVLASLPRTMARVGAVFALTAALGLAVVGSSPFRERFGGDLFGEPGSPIPLKDVSLSTRRVVVVPGDASRLLLSPGGTRFAVGLVSPDAAEDETAFLVEVSDGRLETVRGIALEYLDEERLLVVEKNGTRALLKAATVSDTETAVVVHEMPLLAGAELDADGSGNWQVTGYDRVEGEFLLIRGSLLGGVPERVRFPVGDELATIVSVNGEGAVLLARYDVPGPALLVSASSPRLVMSLELSKPGGAGVSLGESALSPQCFSSPIPDPDFYCVATDGRRTALFSLVPESSSFEALGFLTGTFPGNELASDARLVMSSWDRPPLLVDLARKVALRPQPRGTLLAWQGNVLAAAEVYGGGNQTIVRLYTVGE